MIHSNRPADSPRATEILLAGDQDLHIALDRMLRDSDWRLRHVMTCREAIEFAKENEVAVVVCQHVLADGDWTTILTELETSGKRPNLVVTARLPDEELWAEVLNLGGYDVLAQPFERDEVVRVIASAWRHGDLLGKAAGS